MPTLPRIDKGLLRRRFDRSLSSYDGSAVVQGRMARLLVEEIRRLGKTRFGSVLEIGCGTGLLSRRMAECLRMERYIANDLVDRCRSFVEEALAADPRLIPRFLAGDIEQLRLPAGPHDLVASNAAFHWLEEPVLLLSRIADSLAPRGRLAFSTFGPDNLGEIRALTGRGLPYASRRETAGMLARRFRLLAEREERVTLRFPAPRDVLDHLRRTGVNGPAGEGWTKGTLRSFEKAYLERYGEDGTVPLTYHTLFFVAGPR